MDRLASRLIAGLLNLGFLTLIPIDELLGGDIGFGVCLDCKISKGGLTYNLSATSNPLGCLSICVACAANKSWVSLVVNKQFCLVPYISSVSLVQSIVLNAIGFVPRLEVCVDRSRDATFIRSDVTARRCLIRLICFHISKLAIHFLKS